MQIEVTWWSESFLTVTAGSSQKHRYPSLGGIQLIPSLPQVAICTSVEMSHDRASFERVGVRLRGTERFLWGSFSSIGIGVSLIVYLPIY